MGKGGSNRLGTSKSAHPRDAFEFIDEDGVRLYAYEPAGYLVSLPGGVIIYHAGDTALSAI
jgi:L-ascorbate metabolism protein UlaG (beta-lactamase superfamily)